MNWNDFNTGTKEQAANALFTCCGSQKFVSLSMEAFPFPSETEFIKNATKIWYEECDAKDWKEAFTHHPKIGDRKSLEEKFASTKHLAGEEQSGVTVASSETIDALAKANEDYEQKFGFIFIVCATGKSAAEMLRLLEDRLSNSETEELAVAMGEQHKITLLRLQKLLPDSDWNWIRGSHLTTHVLDTSIGKPGQDITIRLQAKKGGWQTVAQGVTNSDGRIANLLPTAYYLPQGTYKIVFDTANYFVRQQIKGFYPEVEIQFTVFDDSHYHIPLLINPFGYSTYRGS